MTDYFFRPPPPFFTHAVNPSAVVSPNSQVVLEQLFATLTCTYTGNPAPSITWEREGMVSLPTRHSITSTSQQNNTIGLYIVNNITIWYPDDNFLISYSI